MESMRFALLIITAGIIFAGIVLLIARFEKNRRILKYIPSALLFITAAACFIKAKRFSEGMEGLAYIILAMTVSACFAVALLTAAAVDIVKRIRNGK